MGLFSNDLAMDLGTANTLIHMKGKGIVLNEPSVVAYNVQKEQVLAVGEEAKSYLGRTPQNIKAVRPLKDGVIADFVVTQVMISQFISKVHKVGLIKPKMVICVPAGVTQVEKRAVLEAAKRVGAGKVFLIEEPMAAAIGAELNINEKKGQMIIDIGGGTTEVAVLSEASVVYSETIRVAGDEFNESIISYLTKAHEFQVGENTAEICKIEIGSALHQQGQLENYSIVGKNLVTNNPEERLFSAEEIRVAIKEPLKAVVDVVKRVIENTPQGYINDVKKECIYMAGGGSLLQGINKLISNETNMDCKLTEDPLTTIVKGSGISLDDIKNYRKVFIN